MYLRAKRDNFNTQIAHTLAGRIVRDFPGKVYSAQIQVGKVNLILPTFISNGIYIRQNNATKLGILPHFIRLIPRLGIS